MIWNLPDFVVYFILQDNQERFVNLDQMKWEDILTAQKYKENIKNRKFFQKQK